MKDLTIKRIKSNICSCEISINGNNHTVNSVFSVLEKIYDEMYDSNKSFKDLILEYIKETKDFEFVERLKKEIDIK